MIVKHCHRVFSFSLLTRRDEHCLLLAVPARVAAKREGTVKSLVQPRAGLQGVVLLSGGCFWFWAVLIGDGGISTVRIANQVRSSIRFIIIYLISRPELSHRLSH